MDDSKPPFRAEHVGSLVRPRKLLEARRQHAAGEISSEALQEIEDAAIVDVIALQRDAGLSVATDGEFRRAAWHTDFIAQIHGIEQRPGEFSEITFQGDHGEKATFSFPKLRVGDRIRLGDTIFVRDFTFLQEHVDGATPKISIPSLNMIHYRGGLDNVLESAIYADREEAWADIVGAYRDQLKGLRALGGTYVQIDDTTFGTLCDPNARARLAAGGEDADHLHLDYLGRLNAVLEDRPAGMTVAVHICRGNFRSLWNASGKYDFVAEPLFSQLDVDAFFLEFDDESRTGGFEPLRFVPEGKRVVLGLVSTKHPELESKDELKRRIEDASRFVSIDRLALSPQCGFASAAEGGALDAEQQAAKLRLVAETAHEVWG